MAKKYCKKKKCSLSLAIREIQTETFLRCHVNTEWRRLRKQKATNVGEDAGTPSCTVGVQTGAAAMETNVAVPQDTSNRSAMWPCYTTPGTYLKNSVSYTEMPACPCYSPPLSVGRVRAQGRQGLRAHQLMNRWDENVINIYNEILLSCKEKQTL